ncbi:DUF4055 domain-containing protein [Flavobacterium sp.]|uniref:DUF4055 domain-containing protein n=1 Tax=Flavobacterium sp. TaxID=239 RepID=UPI0037BE8067
MSQYTKMVVGGLLRKRPQLDLPDGAPEDAKDWILDNFGQDDSSISAFLDAALWEELQTSRCWVYVDYPNIPNRTDLTRDEILQFKPYPVMWKAESVINWNVEQDTKSGHLKLTRVIVRMYEESNETNEFHSDMIDTVYVHELVDNRYQIRKFQERSKTNSVPVVNGKVQENYTRDTPVFELVDTITSFEINGEPLHFIPAWPLNGSIPVNEPIITAIVDKEVSLYNKTSRRNHLLYGASTYTPVITSDMTDEEFQKIVGSGLGTWIHLQQGDTASVLQTPTGALIDMDRAIAAAIEEMAKLGIRMLSPETAQSGVALELRNAAQTAQLGTLNTKISSTMCDIIAFMLNWRYGTEYTASDIKFSMSADFNPGPLGDAWLRLITEWYENGLIPRSIWLQILKQNDIVPPEYNDEEGQQQITQDQNLLDKGTRDEMKQFLQGNA